MFYTMIGVNTGQVLIIIILLVLAYTICTRRDDTFKTFLVVGHTIAHICIIGIIANILLRICDIGLANNAKLCTF